MIIGLAGAAGVGKSTLARELCTQRGFIETSFAKPMKELCSDLFGLSIDQLYGDEKEAIDPRWGKSSRQIMQEVGERVRQIHPVVWVRLWSEWAGALVADGVDVVVQDVRYLNEVRAVEALGGSVLILEREGFLYGHGSDLHISERDLLGSGLQRIHPKDLAARLKVQWDISTING